MLTEEQIEAFRTSHGRIAHVVGKAGWEVVFRKPTRNEYKRFRAIANDPAQVANCQEVLARACIVYPEKATEFDALLDDFPGIPEACGKALGELCGMQTEESTK